MQERVHRRSLRSDHHHTVHPLVAQALHRAHDRFPVQRAEARDADGVAAVVRGLLDPEQRRGWSVKRGVEADDPKRSGAPGHERLRHRVGAIVELADGFQDALPRAAPHMGTVVQHAGNSLVRDSGELRDVGHDRGALPAPLRPARASERSPHARLAGTDLTSRM